MGSWSTPVAVGELVSQGAVFGVEHVEHHDADCLLGYPWERKKSTVVGSEPHCSNLG